MSCLKFKKVFFSFKKLVSVVLARKFDRCSQVKQNYNLTTTTHYTTTAQLIEKILTL